MRLTYDVGGGGGVLDSDQTSGGVVMSEERERESDERVKRAKSNVLLEVDTSGRAGE